MKQSISSFVELNVKAVNENVYVEQSSYQAARRAGTIKSNLNCCQMFEKAPEAKINAFKKVERLGL